MLYDQPPLIFTYTLFYQIGDEMKIWYQSDLDRVYSVLESQTNPIQFLCQAMKISNREGARMSTEEQLDQ